MSTDPKQTRALALRSDEVRGALEHALAGQPRALCDLLARHGGLPGPRPNLDLAAAFGQAVGGEDRRIGPLLRALADEDVAADHARAFLPIAAAFGYAERLGGRSSDEAWAGLSELAADERAPIRLGVLRALTAWVVRAPGPVVGELIERANRWLDDEDREMRFGTAGLVLDVLADRQVVERVEDPAAVRSWIERVIAEVVDAPRAAERSPARRRALAALPAALARVTDALRGGDGLPWLIERCREARHPDLRAALDQTIERLRRGEHAQNVSTLDALRTALASSAKPPRDPARIREGVRGRGKKGKTRAR